MSEQVMNPTGDTGQNTEAPVENAATTVVSGEDWQKKHDEI